MKGSGVIFNTVYNLEQQSLDAISRTMPIYPIGPMVLMTKQSCDKPNVHNNITLFAENRHCLTWLDTMPSSSVLFIAFGSLANTSAHQLRQLAEGLEASQQAFLWVIRPNAIIGHELSSVLPEGFVERTNERGLIVSWVSQVEVLSHPSVGGFLTHCGWNSITENISIGCVPMLCWPQIAEQRLNARILVDEWKVALELINEQESDDIIESSLVQSRIIELLHRGKELKKRILSLKELVSKSIQEGGSSRCYLQSLVEDLKKASRMSPELTTTFKKETNLDIVGKDCL